MKFAFFAITSTVMLILAACGPVTAPPATGAASSAPDAVEQAKGGNPGGGAPANADGNVPAAVPKITQ